MGDWGGFAFFVVLILTGVVLAAAGVVGAARAAERLPERFR
jgi:hypothetical protein